MGDQNVQHKSTDSGAKNAAPADSMLRPRYALFAAIATACIVSLLIIIKTIALYKSGSASVMASLVDSVADLSISICALFAIRYSLKPADFDHRYGHGKIEGLFALFEAAFIAGAAVFILFESLSRFARGAFEVEAHMFSIGVLVLSMIGSIVLVIIHRYSLKYAPSLALESDKANYSTDIVVSAGVIATLTALYFGAPPWLDVIVAVGIAFYMMITAKKVGMGGIDMLLDREVSGELREKLTKIILVNPQVLGFHDLRTRRAGMRIYISCDIEVDADLSLYDAHEICRKVEQDILSACPNADILIHIDPHNDTEDSRHLVADVHHA